MLAKGSRDLTKSGARPKAASDAAKLQREAETAREAAKTRHEANSSELVPTLAQQTALSKLTPPMTLVAFEQMLRRVIQDIFEPIRKQAKQTVERQDELLDADDKMRSDNDALSRRYTKGSADFQKQLETAASKIQEFNRKVEDIKRELTARAKWQDQMQQDMQSYKKRLENHASAKNMTTIAEGVDISISR